MMVADRDLRSPVLQVAAFFDGFLDGEVIKIKQLNQPNDWGEGLRLLLPNGKSVWEMCISDIRIFGWFLCRDVFVATRGGGTAFVKGKETPPSQYSVYRDEVVTIRANLGLSQPDHVAGMRYEDVLSDRS